MGAMLGGRRTEDGFSLVEVLVVVVIISLLAAIAVPIFINQRERAWETQSKTALKNAATAMEAAAVTNNGVYGGVTIDDLVAEEGLKFVPKITRLEVESANDQGFCISVDHTDLAATYYWDSAEGAPSITDCSVKYP